MGQQVNESSKVKNPSESDCTKIKSNGISYFHYTRNEVIFPWPDYNGSNG